MRTFIVANVARHPADIVRRTAEKFGCTRQAVHRHIQRLAREGALVESGKTRSRTYALAELTSWSQSFAVASCGDEGDIWLRYVRQLLSPLASNVMAIWQYGFTEMFNNALDHAQASTITITVDFTKTAAGSVVIMRDVTVSASSAKFRQPWGCWTNAMRCWSWPRASSPQIHSAIPAKGSFSARGCSISSR